MEKEKQITLSKRLREVASFIKKGSYFIDVGSDHAYLPTYVCYYDETARAIASEINEGPYESARQTVVKNDLADKIEVRLGDGLTVLEEDPIDTAVIAGMGGSLIASILEAGKSNLRQVEAIIAQPNIDARAVRLWLINNGYMIIDERLIEENTFIYEIIYAEKTTNDVLLTEQELLFGPVLLKEKSSLFLKKWQSELMNKTRILNQIKQSTKKQIEKEEQFQNEINWIKEVIGNE